jgi:hypothetical protein
MRDYLWQLHVIGALTRLCKLQRWVAMMGCGVWEIPLSLRGRREGAVPFPRVALCPPLKRLRRLLGGLRFAAWLQACAPLGRGDGNGNVRSEWRGAGK